ncbi:MucBP domain-containing protein [Xylocopilactobacillus apis]|uniref:MucBP domain-containing protein n=1 Tax=Xylocopilactobacillus apis TaxID=2932183 RepID=A0AAU9DPK6_9LACO|nr:MucBP domain-containing protein [Xylocopilactobacillus apis]BDR55443.1 hypothetical protein KIMC2_00050 [Xylocopilactobacillus apis]
MSSGQNNRLEEVKKFLSEILSGELTGYKIQQRNDEMFQLTQWAQKQNLITGVDFRTVSDQVAMIDYSGVQVTDKGRQILAESGVQIPEPQKKTDNVVPLNAQSDQQPQQSQVNVDNLLQNMNAGDQETAQSLLQSLREGRSNQLVYSDYLDFFNRNPQFYTYFISAGQEEVPAPQSQEVPPAEASGIFSPEVQRIIAQTENQKAGHEEAAPQATPSEIDNSEPVAVDPNPVPEKESAPEPEVQPQIQPEPVQTYPVQSEPVVEEPVVSKEEVSEPAFESAPVVNIEPEVKEPEPAVEEAPEETVSQSAKTTTHVVIKYLDQDQKEIAPALSIQLTSQTSAYDVSSYQKKIRDYDFVKAENEKGHITSQEINVIFHYEAKLAEGNIKISYVNQQGEKIAEQKVVQGGRIGQFYPLLNDLPDQLVKDLDSRRYVLQSILADNDPTDSSLIYFSDRDQNFTAIFRELLPGRITLRYRNLKNQAIGIGERVMENNVENGDKIAIPLPLVPTGYELDQTLLNGDPVSVGDHFTVSPDEQIIDYVFKRVIADGAIIFNYVDQDGREIAHQTVVRGGRYGEIYDFDANLPQTVINRVNDGVYENNPIIKEETENGTVIPAARITFDNNDHEYSAVFQATEAASITMKFVTTDDNPIPNVTDKVVQGTHYYGDTFVIPNAPSITGFDLNRVMVNDKVAQVDDPVMYSNQEQTVTYVYTIATSTITAHHVDQLGRQIAEDRIITGQIGTTVEQSQLVSLRLNPYYVLSDVLTNNSNYTFTTDPQFITFHYQVDDDLVPEVLNVSDIVLLNCLDTNGNIIGKVTPSSIHLEPVKVGHVYLVHAPDFAGYHLFSQTDTVRIVWNSEKANDFTIVDHPNGLAFIYQSI